MMQNIVEMLNKVTERLERVETGSIGAIPKRKILKSLHGMLTAFQIKNKNCRYSLTFT